MRGFHHASFLQLFRQVERAVGPAPGIDQWQVDDVSWTRERHGFWGRSCSFQIETHEIVRRASGRERWSLLFIAETWWARSREKAVRSIHWGRVEDGQADDVLRWFHSVAARHGAV